MKRFRRNAPTKLILQELLGEGLTSRVYKAIRKHEGLELEQTLAVKVLHSTNRVQALKNEIEVLARIESPHCVRLLGWADLEVGPGILLEYLDGVSLLDLYIYVGIGQSLAEEITAQIQQGLRDLHAHGICHGDISAKNIFITNKGVVKILDFGFSHGGEPGGSRGVTPQFLALEGWERQELTQKSDLFSLGLLRVSLMEHSITQRLSKQEWRKRAQELADTDLLLCTDPAAREFLPVFSQIERRDELTALVEKAQACKKSQNSTTQWLSNAPPEPVKNPRRPFTALPFALFSLVFLFFHQLQPMTAPPALQVVQTEQQFFSLEARSHRWARMDLIKIEGTECRLQMRGVYTPVRWARLEAGQYELQWRSGGKLRDKSNRRTGIISVQLDQNRRILIK